MRDLSKVQSCSRPGTFILLLQVPSLHLAMAAAKPLTRERLICPSTNPKGTFCDSQAKSQKIMVAQCVTISLILHVKDKTSCVCFKHTELAQSTKSPHVPPQKWTVSLETNTHITPHNEFNRFQPKPTKQTRCTGIIRAPLDPSSALETLCQGW